MADILPFGSWTSPVTSELLVEQVVNLSDPLADGSELYWLERRPTEGGRQVIVRCSADGELTDLLAPPWSARTRVHEYGGLPYAVRDGTVWFAAVADQRLYRLDRRSGDPRPITAEPPAPAAWRYAAPTPTPDGRFLVCVRERHGDSGVVNDLVAVSADGSGPGIVVLASGRDFYGTPAVSPVGRRVAFCCWDHPRMPWDGCELWEIDLPAAVLPVGAAPLTSSGDSLASPAGRRLAGGADGEGGKGEEAITQPRYGPGGELYYVSDRTGWWNLYRADAGAGGRAGAGDSTALAPLEAEFASPDWVFGLSNYAVLGDGTVVACCFSGGVSQLGVLRDGSLEPIPSDYLAFACVRPYGTGVVTLAASPTLAPALVTVDVATGEHHVLRRSRETNLDEGYLSRPRPLELSGPDGSPVHVLLYPPTNRDHEAPPGERPPLVVSVHGGPTSVSSPTLDYGVQYLTSRGFAVAAVNYSGSSGYGRHYRRRLEGQWGVLDVADCEHAALALAAAGEADRDRLCIHGGSAGGYTVLCAATFGTVFAAGASYYGVADPAVLARDTHKFESRYLDGLIGPWPEASRRYEERSPLAHAGEIAMPLIVFQGLEDRVVPPNQAELIVEALRANGRPVAYLAYEGEDHGFRRAENIVRTAEAELYFYGKVLGFEPADHIEPVVIDNLEALRPR